MRVNDIAHALNTLVAGQVVSTFPPAASNTMSGCARRAQYRTSVEGLSQLTVFSTNKQGWVPLDQVVRSRPAPRHRASAGWTASARSSSARTCCRADRRREVISALEDRGKDIHMDPGYGTAVTGTGKELGRSGLLFRPGVRAHVHLYVHRAGGAI